MIVVVLVVGSLSGLLESHLERLLDVCLISQPLESNSKYNVYQITTKRGPSKRIVHPEKKAMKNPNTARPKPFQSDHARSLIHIKTAP